MKKIIPVLIASLALTACGSTEVHSYTEFAEVDCSSPESAPEYYNVEWEGVNFKLPFCWSIEEVPKASQPLVVLRDEEEGANGVITFTYDPTIEFDLVVNHISTDADTMLIIDSLK